MAANNLVRPKLPEFTGDQPETFDLWFKKFELFVAEPPPAGAQPRHVVLPLYLSGRAFMTYDALTDAQKGNYNNLKQALRERLVPGDHDLIRRQDFMGMVRKPGEALTAFELRIMEAVGIAYADFQPQARAALAKEQFVRGIGDGDTQLHLLTHQPATLRAAVQLAEQFDQVQRVAHGKSTVNVLKDKKPEDTNTADPAVKELTEQVRKLTEQVKEMRMGQEKSMNTTKERSNQGSGSGADSSGARSGDGQGRGRGRWRGRGQGYPRDRAPSRNPGQVQFSSQFGNFYMEKDYDGYQHIYSNPNRGSSSRGQGYQQAFDVTDYRRQQQPAVGSGPQPQFTQSYQRQPFQSGGQQHTSPPQDMSTLQCDRCGEFGHKWRKCPKGRGRRPVPNQGE